VFITQYYTHNLDEIFTKYVKINHRYIFFILFLHDEQVHPLLVTNVFQIQYRPSIISSAQPINMQNWREYSNATTWG
jgi:hypothetical protein